MISTAPSYLLIAHLTGDFLLQNHWMQKKTTSSWHCAVHVAFYLVPFWLCDLPAWAILLIGLQHFLQDRFGWAAKWQAFIKQTPVEVWPQGRLWVDQTIHALWIYIVFSVVQGGLQ